MGVQYIWVDAVGAKALETCAPQLQCKLWWTTNGQKRRFRTESAQVVNRSVIWNAHWRLEFHSDTPDPILCFEVHDSSCNPTRPVAIVRLDARTFQPDLLSDSFYPFQPCDDSLFQVPINGQLHCGITLTNSPNPPAQCATVPGTGNPNQGVANFQGAPQVPMYSPLPPMQPPQGPNYGAPPLYNQNMPPYNPNGPPPYNPNGQPPYSPHGPPPYNPHGQPPYNPNGPPPYNPNPQMMRPPSYGHGEPGNSANNSYTYNPNPSSKANKKQPGAPPEVPAGAAAKIAAQLKKYAFG